MPKVTFIPKVCLDYFPDNIALISIGEPAEDVVELRLERFSNVLRLEFDDVEYDIGPEYTTFDYLKGLKVLDWITRQSADQNIVVHCHAGISRSAAVAKFMIDRLGYELWTHERSYNNHDAFNTLVYRQLELVQLDHKKFQFRR